MWIIEPPNRLKDDWFFKLDNVFSEDELSIIQTYVADNKTYIKPATVVSNDPNTPNFRRTDILFLTDYQVLDSIYRRLTDLVKEVNNNYFKWTLYFMENLQYAEYREEVQGFYTSHTDTGLKGDNGTTRKLSFSVLLNDVTAFEGGQLILNSFEQGINLNLIKNQIVFFPSFMPHTVTPVTKGVRKSLVGWVRGPNFV